jgi:Spy/CpxP family protein refolding chaperone
MAKRYLMAFVFVASLVNAVPSRAEFHPIRWRSDPSQDDIMGSGLELQNERRARMHAAMRGDAPDEEAAEGWRDLARRVRRLAARVPDQERQMLLDLADEYDARAARLEQPRRA